MNKTKKIITLILFFTLIISDQLYSQIIEGRTFVYKEGVYDMSNSDGWKRVEINGGFSKLPTASYINFKNKSIILNVGKTEIREEIYLYLKPKHTEYFNKYTVFGDTWFIPKINAVGPSDNSIDIDYFESKIWNDGKGILLFSDYKNKTMYIFKSDENIDELISKLYN